MTALVEREAAVRVILDALKSNPTETFADARWNMALAEALEAVRALPDIQPAAAQVAKAAEAAVDFLMDDYPDNDMVRSDAEREVASIITRNLVVSPAAEAMKPLTRREILDYLFDHCTHQERDRNYDWCPDCVIAALQQVEVK